MAEKTPRATAQNGRPGDSCADFYVFTCALTTGALYNNCGNERIEAPCYIYKIAYLPNGQILLHFAENATPRP